MNHTQLLMHFLCGYIFLNLDEDGNTTLDCTSIAIQLGVKKNQVEYALASLVIDKFCNPFAFQLQSFCRLTLYDTKGCEVSVANKLQRFCRVVAHLDINYENLKKSNNETLENHKKSGATSEGFDGVDNNISNIYISNNILDNNRGVGEEEDAEKKSAKKTKADFKETCLQVMCVWNECCPTLPAPKVASEKRQQGVQCRIQELRQAYPDNNPMDLIRRLCEKVNESDYLSGRTGVWKASFDWIFCYKGNYLKVIEGNYDNIKQSAVQPQLTPQQQYEAECEENIRRQMLKDMEECKRRWDEEHSKPREVRIQEWIHRMNRDYGLTEEEIRAKYAHVIEQF